MKFKAVIFDMDGLLFDTEKVFNKAWQTLADSRGLILDLRMLDQLRGTSGKQMLKIINNYWPEEDEKILMEEVFKVAEVLLKEYVPIKPGAVELLNFLQKRSVPMAIATSSPRYLVERNLQVTGFDKLFEAIVCREDIHNGKPDPEIFLKAAEKLKKNAQECIVLEDAVHGVKAGLNAHCKTFMIPDLIQPDEEILNSDVLILKDLNQVIDVLIKNDWI